MFGGFAPPQISQAELRQREEEAAGTVKMVLAGVVGLYLSPFVVKFFENYV
ncbi:mitochondrial outer membrane translocase complex, subunit Tom5 [Echria macrotheca]|uniref:Mitochondrial outer membrane translocase complex, subunit Tom5 n=1 Tax=Echria macrotheca TaxID=438768 RepID=A0AAJ0BGZ6_9PEZI|nr:mitochondrial outer membrane translocase complex, subunit Tom5 [Echria macrotheca]